MIQRQWDLIPLGVHALRVRTIVLVVNRQRIPAGKRSTAKAPDTATDSTIDHGMRIGRQRSHANADRCAEHRPTYGPQGHLGGVRMRPFSGPCPTGFILRVERGEIGLQPREDSG
jgi:hypothetical protein